jgi:UDP-glucose 4-epimerase
MKISVIGSTGFIGANLTREAISRGHEVFEFNSKRPFINQSKLNSDLINSDLIYWCASYVNPVTAEDNKNLVEIEFKVWADFLNELPKNFVNALQIVFLSSGGCVYSGSESQFSEKSETKGSNAYGRLKVRMESALLDTYPNALILRVANVYGPGQQHGRKQGVISEWAYSVRAQRPIQVFGSLDSYRDYIYVGDLVDAMLCIEPGQNKPLILNVGTGVRTKLSEILDEFKLYFGENLDIEHKAGRNSDRLGFVLNTSAIQNTFGWTPKTSIHEGIFKTLSNNTTELENRDT